MKNKKRKIVILLTSIITALITIFIFANSMQTANESGATSDMLVDWLRNPLRSLGLDISDDMISFIIRKTAHFAEYFILGAVFAIDLIHIFNSKIASLFSPIYCASVAFIDEYLIQGATEGRSPELRDVLIDFSGAVFAVVFIFTVLYIARKKKKA